jgi:DNA/RNA endonuclease YhcR with UshA esterase domain
MKLFVICAFSLGLTIAAKTSYAHHGTAAYQEDKQVTVTGAVTDFEFANPHTLVFLDVKQSDGTVAKWQGEMTSPNHLVRAGWTRNTLHAGERITITGLAMKRGARSIWIRKIVKADGTELPLVME